jgi:hypothetical protein
MSARVLIGIALLGAFLLIAGEGCAPPAQEVGKELAKPSEVVEKPVIKPEPATLALKFTQGEVDRYKAVSELRKDYRFEQPAKKESKEEYSHAWMEMIFSQRITHVGEEGSALTEITIEGLKCYSALTQDVKLDFDSSRTGSGSEPLAKLIGQSYTIRMFPDGTVKYVDAAKARTVIREGLAASAAERIFSDEGIETRHTVPALLGRSDSPARKGMQWSAVVDAPKGMLQPKKYEKAYRLTQTTDEKGRNIAVVQMQARAVEKMDEEGQVIDFFKQFFKGADKYAGDGELVLNLDSGKVEKSSEKLEASWMAADPDYSDENGPGPDVLMMGFIQSRSLEKLD